MADTNIRIHLEGGDGEGPENKPGPSQSIGGEGSRPDVKSGTEPHKAQVTPAKSELSDLIVKPQLDPSEAKSQLDQLQASTRDEEAHLRSQIAQSETKSPDPPPEDLSSLIGPQPPPDDPIQVDEAASKEILRRKKRRQRRAKASRKRKRLRVLSQQRQQAKKQAQQQTRQQNQVNAANLRMSRTASSRRRGSRRRSKKRRLLRQLRASRIPKSQLSAATRIVGGQLFGGQAATALGASVTAAASGATLIAGITAGAAALAALTYAAHRLDQELLSIAEDIAPFSRELLSARAESSQLRLLGRFRTAEQLGPQLADFVHERNQLSVEFGKLRNEVLRNLIPKATEAVAILTNLLGGITQVVKFLQTIEDLQPEWFKELRSLSNPLTAQFLLIKKLSEFADWWKGKNAGDGSLDLARELEEFFSPASVIPLHDRMPPPGDPRRRGGVL